MSGTQAQPAAQRTRKGVLKFLIPILILIALAIIVYAPRRLTPTSEVDVPSVLGESEGKPATLEPIAEGAAGLSRVVLTEKTVKRLGIQTSLLREAQVVRKRTVGGKVVSPSSAGSQSKLGVWIQVRLSESDLPKVDLSKPARVVPLVPIGARGWTVPVVQVRAEEDELYYAVDGAGRSLVPGQAVSVELPVFGSGTIRKTVPYSAVLYDLSGDTWVYTAPTPLTFVRQPIKVDYIEGDLAILSEGPPAGTPVVTVGLAPLIGVETGVGK